MIPNKEEIEKYEAARKRRMTIAEAHELEIDLEQQLKREDPNNEALRYYGTTWVAIEAYQVALAKLKRDKNDSNV